MNTPEEPRQTEEVRIGVGGGVVVPTQPQEVAYPLRRETFDVLCEGERTKKDERWRDVSISICATSFLALITMMVTVDWQKMHPDTNLLGFLLVVLVAAIFLATLALSFIFNRKVGQQPASSSYARVKKKIIGWFEQRDQ